MIFPDKKKQSGIVFSKIDSGGNSKEGPLMNLEEAFGGADDEALKAIAADIIEAFHSKSAQDVMVALKAFITHCKDYEEEMPEE